VTDQPNEHQLLGRRILISGGTSGIGYAVAQHLAARNQVWILGSSQTTLAAARQGLPVVGGSSCDVADAAAVEQAVDSAVAALGGLDAAFVNAGIDGQAVSALNLNVDRFRRLLDVNVIGCFQVAQRAIRAMGTAGAVVLNASINAVRPERDFLDYNASKAAVVSMAKTMALELGDREISVIALCPGYFPTRMTAPYLEDAESRNQLLARIPAGRLGRLEEIPPVVDFLLSPAASYLTGSVITLDGGANV